MGSFWTRVIGDKKEWRSMEARADALPRDYRIVYAEIKPYLWKFTTGDGMDTVAVLRDVLPFAAGFGIVFSHTTCGFCGSVTSSA